MKSIIISIKPELVAKILNGEKTIEIRKTAPKCDLPIEVYIYCTKKGRIGETLIKHAFDGKYRVGNCVGSNGNEPLNGKVCAKFTLDEIYTYQIEDKRTWKDPGFEETTRKLMGMGLDELHNYVSDKTFYGWHISDLEIFEEPRELDEFEYPCPSGTRYVGQCSINGLPSKKHPPQSWCYVEDEK